MKLMILNISIREKLLFIILFLFKNITFAQVFYAQGGKIQDYQDHFWIDTFKLEVKGLPTNINAAFGLSKVCLDIGHQKVSDLKVELLSPSGASIWLTNRNGGDRGVNYSSTCFRSNGFSGYIHQGTAPFTGEYIPDGRFNFLNNNQNPNGVWKLLISDLHKGDIGNLNYFTLEFSTNPTPNNGDNPCSFENPKACKCDKNSKEGELLPDLIILKRFTETQIKEYPKDDKNYAGQLRFAATIANIGDGPMEVFGNDEWYCGEEKVEKSAHCTDGKYPRQRLYQRIFYKKDSTLIYKDFPAGTNYYDNKPGHDHYHVDDWVEFRLLKKKKSILKKHRYSVISKGSKVSYCLWDTGICNNNDSLCMWKKKVFGEKNLPNYGLGNYFECKSHKQGISVGGYDTYGLLYEGQFIDLPKGLKSGGYYLQIIIDPKNRYIEKNKSNNNFLMPFQISKQE